MNIPLIAKPTIDKYSKDQKLEIWSNSHVFYVDAPFKPYFYSSYPLKLDAIKYETEKLNKILLSNLQSTEVYKYNFQNTLIAKEHQEEDTIEHQISYTDRILIDEHNFFTKFKNDQPLKVLHFDIETDTTGMFPAPERNAIIAIGAKCGDRKAIFMSETYDDDKVILNKFFDFMQKTDPDIITHYNGDSFDIPYCMERMKINKIPLNRWSRNNKDIHKYKNTISIGGRVSFDLYHEAQRDQTLSGIKNLKMKTLAKWLKLADIKEVPYTEMRNMVNTTKLKEYLISDVNITESLFNIYFKNVQMLAEMNKVPLNLMIGANASFLPNIIHGRKYKQLGIISDGFNGKRHPKYIKNKRGALVDTFKPGLYNHSIFKIDYASQYPRAVQTFNLSPDTVRIIRYDIYNGKYNFDISNPDKYIYSIPDEKANKNIIISVDMSKRGFLAKFMDDVLTERFDIKKRMKSMEKGTPEYEGLHVRQNALKVVANIQTGYEGQEFALFGDLGTYCMITGMCRYYIQLAMNGVKCQK
jgi:DNA polymerase elongation subunit (family B)